MSPHLPNTSDKLPGLAAAGLPSKLGVDARTLPRSHLLPPGLASFIGLLCRHPGHASSPAGRVSESLRAKVENEMNNCCRVPTDQVLRLVQLQVPTDKPILCPLWKNQRAFPKRRVW